MKKLLVASGLVLAVFIAAISETSAQTIYSCYNKKSGAMRYVTGPGKCKKTETEISWNTTGPKGDKGDTGPAGLAGATGAQGPEGPPGVANGIQRAVYGSLYLTSLTPPVYEQLSGAGFTFTTLSDATYGVYVHITFDTPWSVPPTCTVTPFEPALTNTAIWYWSAPQEFLPNNYPAIDVVCSELIATHPSPVSFSFICVQ